MASLKRKAAIEVLFGLGCAHAQEWPGIIVIFNRLEIEFEVLLRAEFDILWRILGREKPSDARACWFWCFAVLQTLRSLEANESVSMENVYLHLISDRSVKPTAPEKACILLAIFAVLCWTSMMLVPALEPEQTTMTETPSSPCFRAKGLEPAEQSQTSLHSTSRRPITKLFGIFRSLLQEAGSDGATSAVRDVDTIHESSVNFFSLHTVGRVRIKWVEDLTSHLAFDRQSRTLSVFCFPTFCVSSILRAQEIRILQQLSSELFPSTHYSDYSNQDPSSLHREVLLTYRVLFGQSSQSRALALKLIQQLRAASSTGDVDPFLSTICTVSTAASRLFRRRLANPDLPGYLFPATILDVDDQLMESDTYSSGDDFPHFGSRLLAVQQYNLRQQPRRIRDLWRDRRNPLQWYTFWAVLWVGGITIVLALLQLVAAIIQTYYSAGGSN
ncbi:hypothetical protein ACQKWADRAFT_323135 [Trichoderma austrokoningii]